MARLTKYTSFKALKLDAAASETNLKNPKERHLAFEKFINVLQKELSQKRGENYSNATKNSD